MSGRLEKKSTVKYNLGLKLKKKKANPGNTFPNPKGKQSRTQPDKKHRRDARGAQTKHTQKQHSAAQHTPQCIIVYQLSATAANIQGLAGSGSILLSYVWNSCSEEDYI